MTCLGSPQKELWYLLLKSSVNPNATTGSPLISRDGWIRLLEAQGFKSVVVAGESNNVPTLLTRQTVVLGLSDGVVRLHPNYTATTGTERALTTHLLDAANSALPSGIDAESESVRVDIIKVQLQRIVEEVLSSDVGDDQPLMEAGLDSIGTLHNMTLDSSEWLNGKYHINNAASGSV